MEEFKYLPPKFSGALKDLTAYLEVFEISESEMKKNRRHNNEKSQNK